MVSRCLLTFTALLYCVKDVQAATYTMLVNDAVIPGANGVRGGFTTVSDVKVACQFPSGLSDPDIVKVIPNTPDSVIDPHYLQLSYVQNNKQIVYFLNATDKRGTVTYRCIDKNYVGCPDYSQVTISFTTTTPRPGPSLQSNCPPGGSNDRPSVNPSSGPSNRPTVPSSTATYTMLVNGALVPGANGVRGGFTTTSTVTVACRFAIDLSEPDIVKVVPNSPDSVIEQRYLQQSYIQSYKQIAYFLDATDKRGTATYRCIDKNYVGCPDYSQVTISFTTTAPRPGPYLQSNCPPGSSNDRPSVNPSSGPSNRPAVPSSSGGTAAGQKFAGLNPLIYTISAVIGTLAI